MKRKPDEIRGQFFKRLSATERLKVLRVFLDISDAAAAEVNSHSTEAKLLSVILRPTAPDPQAVNTITLTGHQLVAALDLIAPGLPRDANELNDELTFGVRQHKDDDGIVANGMCCWNDNTDGVLPLDEHPDPTSKQKIYEGRNG